MKRQSPRGRNTNTHRSPRAARRPTALRPRYEMLEDRKMLTAYINEIYFDPPGSGGDKVFEYIELRGPASTPLTDYYLIQVENEGAPMGNPGDIDMIWDLGSYSFGSNGFLTMRQANPTPNQYTVNGSSTNLVAAGPSWAGLAVDDGSDGVIENSGGTFMLIHNVSGAAPMLSDDLDVDNNGLDVPTGKAGWVIDDAIGIHSEFGEAATGRLYAQINFGPEPTTSIEPGATYVGLNFEVELIARWGDSTGQTADDWHITNLTDNPLSGYKTMGDFRQSGDPHGLAITGRQVFYNDSGFDGNTPGPSAADNGAIDTTKTAYLPGSGAITSASMTNYSKGLNGVMIDIGQDPGQMLESSQGVLYGTNLTGTLGTTNIGAVESPGHRPFSLSDFAFAMSGQGVAANNTPSSWAAAPTPTLSVLTDTPTVGTDRVELIWPNGAIQDRFLEITVKGLDFAGGFNTVTGLVETDIFYFGNKVGDTFTDGGFFGTDATDEIQARNHQGIAFSPTNLYDFNKDFSVDATDQILSRNNGGFMPAISITDPPAAPRVGDGPVGLALNAPAAESRRESKAAAPVPATLDAADATPIAASVEDSVDASNAALTLGDEEWDEILGPDEELFEALAAIWAR